MKRWQVIAISGQAEYPSLCPGCKTVVPKSKANIAFCNLHQFLHFLDVFREMLLYDGIYCIPLFLSGHAAIRPSELPPHDSNPASVSASRRLMRNRRAILHHCSLHLCPGKGNLRVRLLPGCFCCLARLPIPRSACRRLKLCRIFDHYCHCRCQMDLHDEKRIVPSDTGTEGTLLVKNIIYNRSGKER